uniref:Putative transmembrane protein n=1 Tax=Toxoplasma gondii COUG TaxID=1074873 RepID=A0A2G8Y6V4_TOXGO|nr:putative transmembrane protein [Toxoplasma gondii COUG]
MRLSVSSRVDAHQFPRSRLASLYFLCLYASAGSYRVLLLCLSSTIPFLCVSRCSLFLSLCVASFRARGSLLASLFLLCVPLPLSFAGCSYCNAVPALPTALLVLRICFCVGASLSFTLLVLRESVW